MALIDIKLFSTSLLTNTDVRVVLPTPDEPFYSDDTPWYDRSKRYQVLYLLHGAHGDCTVWTRNTGIERYAQKYKIVVVSASVTNSCYMDMAHGGKFFTYMTQELPRFIESVFSVSTRREDTFIAGMSMGGYGAFRLGLAQPERYSCIVSLSGAIDITSGLESRKTSIQMEDVFGTLSQVGTDNDNLWKLEQLLKQGVQVPKIYQCCGTEDFLYESNQVARRKLEQLGVDFTYDEGPGIHNWDYWDPQIRKILDWLPLKGTLVDV